MQNLGKNSYMGHNLWQIMFNIILKLLCLPRIRHFVFFFSKTVFYYSEMGEPIFWKLCMILSLVETLLGKNHQRNQFHVSTKWHFLVVLAHFRCLS